MTTLKEYAREMFYREPELGSVHAITGLAVGSVTVAQLATGNVSANHYKNKWLVRRDASASNAADRKRVCTNFTNSSGLFAHTGANYGDTIVGTEILEIAEFDPYYQDRSIQHIVKRLRFLDHAMLPTRNADRYWLTREFSWLTAPSDIRRVRTRTIPVISRNQWFDKWYTVNATTGALEPDDWTISGGTVSRITGLGRSSYSLQMVTSGGVAGYIEQTPGLLETDVSTDSLRGKVVTAYALTKSGVASSHRIEIYDGVNTVYSDYHTGGGAAEQLTKQHTVDTAATTLRIRLHQAQNGTEEIIRFGLCLGPITDSIWRDNAGFGDPIEPRWETPGPLQMILPRSSAHGSQIIVESFRPYPGFNETLLAAGTADATEQDAPVDIVAEGALWHLYSTQGTNAQHAKIANRHWQNFQEMAGEYLYMDNDDETGLPFLQGVSGPSVRRL